MLFRSAGWSVQGSYAAVNGRTQNPNNVFAMTALYAPSSLTAVPAGHDVSLSWSAGQNGNGNAVLGVANGTSSNCTGASFGSVGTASGTSYTDTGRFSPQGTYFCYQVQTTYASWTSVQNNPVAAAQIGVVATSVQATNGGTAGVLDPGDTIVINFNQPVNPASGPSGTDTVCSVIAGAPNGQILLGSTTTNGGCATNEAVDLGKLTGGGSNRNARYNATYVWTNSNTTLTVTIGNRLLGTNPTITGTWTLNPTTTATKLLSATGGFHICDTNAGGGNCLPTTASNF